jgi:hypothetical protein
MLFSLLASGCVSTRNTSTERTSATPGQISNVFEGFLHAPIPPADGFDFAFGNPDGKGDYTDKATGQRFFHGAVW